MPFSSPRKKAILLEVAREFYSRHTGVGRGVDVNKGQDMALTIRQTERLKKAGRYGDGNNLYLQITRTGCKSWILRYVRDGREHLMGLGPFATFNLEEARERARLARQQLANGIDPLAERKSQKSAATLAAIKTMSFT